MVTDVRDATHVDQRERAVGRVEAPGRAQDRDRGDVAAALDQDDDPSVRRDARLARAVRAHAVPSFVLAG
jgi:hypothetical protein